MDIGGGDEFELVADDWLLGYGSNHKILAIKNSSAETAAYVVVGAGAGHLEQSYHLGLGKFDVVASVGASSLEITSSKYVGEYVEHTPSFIPDFS